ncbi:unnamed protein product [Larinioides sclopetarius]|uniref:Uncharacterized protein n=1 Tax=Larinioides sclopetarius TaxID=280406 RepID=A0AAV1YRI9_9ARAC
MALLKDRPGITLPKGEPQRRKQEKPRLVQRALSQVTSMAFAEAARRFWCGKMVVKPVWFKIVFYFNMMIIHL